MARLRDSWRTSLPASQQPRNPQSESIARTPYDIGLPPPYAPMDFAAWIEVFLGGRWHTFDPRNNDPRIGRILIARGRDAADVPLTLTFGPNTLVGFKVVTEEVPA